MHEYVFPFQTFQPLPQDHGYHLLAGLSRCVPSLHGRHNIQIAPLTNMNRQNDRLVSSSQSQVVLRGISDAEASALERKVFQLGTADCALGAHFTRPINYSKTLVSRLTIFDMEGPLAPDTFLAEFLARWSPRVDVTGVEFDLGSVRALEIKNHFRLGFSVRLTQLTEAQHKDLVTTGIGHHRSMGCGVFRPA